MQTYLNDPQLKADFLAEIAKHERQDAIIKGTYGSRNGGQFKGCAIGCALHSLNILKGTESAKNTSDHERYEAELGLPTWFAFLEDQIFENLPDALARTWPRRIAEAIPIGAVVDDRVLARILCWVLTDTDFGVRYATERGDERDWIDAIATWIDMESQGIATADQREAAARAARAAWDAWAAWAAWAAWDAWAARAARDAWDARAARAARAAWDAWAARDAWAAWDAWAARAAWAAWDARAAWAAWDAWAARAARDAWDARAARDAWDARDATTNSSRAQQAAKAAAFFPALSEFVLAVVRALPAVTL